MYSELTYMAIDKFSFCSLTLNTLIGCEPIKPTKLEIAAINNTLGSLISIYVNKGWIEGESGVRLNNYSGSFSKLSSNGRKAYR